MTRPNVHLIAAVGQSGQIGLAGGLPWPRELGDLPWFRAVTCHNILIMGPKTAASVGALPNRTIETWRGEDPAAFLETLAKRYGNRALFVAGGARCYRAFGPFVSKWLVTRVAFDGPADTYWPFNLPWGAR